MKIIKTILKLILAVSILIALVLGSIILYATVTAYKPELATKIKTEISKQRFDKVPNKIKILNWNIGFAGLGKDMDFFYDGGKMVHPTKKQNATYYKGIKTFLESKNSMDFVLLQEVDRASKRSYYLDQFLDLKKTFVNFTASFAYNYKCEIVPKPFTNPLGKVNSGLATYAKYKPTENIRYQFPGDFIWPKHLFMLKRCFLFQRYETENGKELIMVNTHNSAYDDGGFLKKKQMEFLKSFLVSEYKKGNYVIVGGDWNQIPADFNNLTFKKTQEASEQIPVEKNYIKDWKWHYDGKVSTNRKLKTPYDSDKTFTTVIDFFLVSPNVNLTSIKGIDLDFKFSDHNPVAIELELK